MDVAQANPGEFIPPALSPAREYQIIAPCGHKAVPGQRKCETKSCTVDNDLEWKACCIPGCNNAILKEMKICRGHLYGAWYFLSNTSVCPVKDCVSPVYSNPHCFCWAHFRAWKDRSGTSSFKHWLSYQVPRPQVRLACGDVVAEGSSCKVSGHQEELAWQPKMCGTCNKVQARRDDLCPDCALAKLREELAGPLIEDAHEVNDDTMSTAATETGGDQDQAPVAPITVASVSPAAVPSVSTPPPPPKPVARRVPKRGRPKTTTIATRSTAVAEKRKKPSDDAPAAMPQSNVSTSPVAVPPLAPLSSPAVVVRAPAPVANPPTAATELKLTISRAILMKAICVLASNENLPPAASFVLGRLLADGACEAVVTDPAWLAAAVAMWK